MVPQERVLAVGGETIDVVAPLLEQSPYAIERVPDGRTAVLLARKMHYQHLVVAFPLPDLTLDEFFDRLRRSDSASPTARLLLVTDDEHLEAAAAYRDEGLIAGAISIDLEAERLVELLTGFMKTAPRVSVGMAVRVRPLSGEGESVDGETVNLSESGVLVRTLITLPRGLKVAVELDTPRSSEPIKAEAVVVRKANPQLERVSGMGLRFVSFEGDGLPRLAVHIRGLLAEFVV